MPAPVTHIVLALLVMPFLPGKNKRDFVLGTSFPDIRYYRVIDRSTSHVPNPSWQHIVEEKSSFKAGMEFHALVDLIHDDYVRHHSIVHLLPKQWKSSAHHFKFFEDMVLYSCVSDWSEIAGYFDTILKEENEMVSDPRAVIVWHETLKKYVSQKPGPESVFEMLDVRLPQWYNFIIRIPVRLNAHFITTTFVTGLNYALVNTLLVDKIHDFYDDFLQQLDPCGDLKIASDKILLHW